MYVSAICRASRILGAVRKKKKTGYSFFIYYLSAMMNNQGQGTRRLGRDTIFSLTPVQACGIM